MTKLTIAPRLVVALLGAVSAGACATESPVGPSPSSVMAGEQHAKGSQAAPGVYDLSFNVFQNGTYQEVSSLPVRSQELILKAYVADSTGGPARKGSVTFEYCSYSGGPANDIDRPDEAPLEACAEGTATWARLASMSVTAGRCPLLGNGYACVNFGVVQIPRDVGFRIRYEPQGSGIAAGMTLPENFTWVAGS
jgi:hypothetical protein